MSRHMMAPLAALVAVAMGLASASAATIESITFETRVTPPATRLPDALRGYEATFRTGLANLPESLLVTGGLSMGGSAMGLSTNQATKLLPLVSDAYAKIAVDPAFTNVPSALPYCFSPTKPKIGHYFLYRPDEIPKDPECIVFLHGYAGNFQFYPWVLKEAFPKTVILAPSWSISWHDGSARYVEDALADAEQRLGVKLTTPWLIGLSAGGRVGFKVYQRMADRFAGFVCLVNAPETAVARSLRRDLKILMINGTEDELVPIEIARRQAALAKQRLPTLKFRELEGGHFLILAHREETFGTIREFMQRR